MKEVLAASVDDATPLDNHTSTVQAKIVSVKDRFMRNFAIFNRAADDGKAGADNEIMNSVLKVILSNWRIQDDRTVPTF